MTRFLFGLMTIGWLGCSVAEPTPSVSEATAPATSEATDDLTLGTAPRPEFSQCLQGATCVLNQSCTGTHTAVPCGAGGLHCCNPVACSGQCIARSFCDTASRTQVIDGNATCPNGGVCCITLN